MAATSAEDARGLMSLGVLSPDLEAGAYSSRIPAVSSFLRLGDGACLGWQLPSSGGVGCEALWSEYCGKWFATLHDTK